jgi:hypothetical protein
MEDTKKDIYISEYISEYIYIIDMSGCIHVDLYADLYMYTSE